MMNKIFKLLVILMFPLTVLASNYTNHYRLEIPDSGTRDWWNIYNYTIVSLDTAIFNVSTSLTSISAGNITGNLNITLVNATTYQNLPTSGAGFTNLNAANATGSGVGLTIIPGANITGTVPTMNITNGLTVGNITTNSTLIGNNATFGNISNTLNLTTGNISASGLIVAANINTSGAGNFTTLYEAGKRAIVTGGSAVSLTSIPLANGTGAVPTASYSVGTAITGIIWGNITGIPNQTLNTTDNVTFNDIITKGPYIDIRAYGAVGDGITNDTIAFSNALDAAIAANKTLYIPSGTFLVTGLVKTIDSRFRVAGDSAENSIISNGTEMSLSKGFEIRNVGFDNWRGAGSGYPFLLNTSSGGIDNIIIDHVRATNSQGFLYADWGGATTIGNIISNIRVTNSYFGNIYRYGVRLYSAVRDVDISHNTFENMLGPTASTAIALGGGVYANSSRVTIQTNRISNLTGNSGSEVHGIIFYGTYSLIDGNTIVNLSDGTDHEPLYFKGNHNKVSNNVINSDSGTGSHATLYAGGNAAESGHNIISDNIIVSPTSANNGIAVVGGAVITGNIIECPVAGGGILGAGDYSSYVFIVSGNRINVTDDGIHLQDSRESLIEGNNIVTSKATASGISLTRINATTNPYAAENLTIADNYIKTNSTSGFSLAVAGAYLSDFKMKDNTFVLKGTVTRTFNNLDVINGSSIIKDNSINGFTNGTLSNTATPDLEYGFYPVWNTGGTTTITDFDYGYPGYTMTIVAAHNVTITHGTNIFLSGNTNFNMLVNDTLTLLQQNNTLWYETGRKDSRLPIFTGGVGTTLTSIPGANVTANGTQQLVEIYNGTAAVGVNKKIRFIAGQNSTIALANDSTGAINVTINCS